MLSVIPAPLHVIPSRGQFRLRPGTRIVIADLALSPIAERFVRDVRRRIGISLALARDGEGAAGGGAPAIRVVLVDDRRIATLPRPIGEHPAAEHAPDERHALSIAADGVEVRAAEPVGVARALTTLLQLAATARIDGAEAVLPAAHILDAPRYAWRGLSLDLTRAFLAVREIERVIDLLALYKLDVLNLRLTDDDAWRIAAGRAGAGDPADAPYADVELRALVHYAGKRFVTLVPEFDTPGRASALLRLRPDLDTGRNVVAFEAGGQVHRTAWLDPALPATFRVVEELLRALAAIFPARYVNVGGEEPIGMPRAPYLEFVRHERAFVRSLGRRTMGWPATAGADDDPDHLVLPFDRHACLDAPYAEPSAEPAQEARRLRLGQRTRRPRTIAEAFDAELPLGPGAPGEPRRPVGIGASIGAEPAASFDDLALLLLPGLAGVAHRAWSDPASGDWRDHRARLAPHARLWTDDDLSYFRASSVDWAPARHLPWAG